MTELIYKIIPRADWENCGEAYQGSAHDQRDGFLHFSTAAQLPETLKRHYVGLTDLVLVAVNTESLRTALKWELAPKRGEDFPHLYSPLHKSAILWARPIVPEAPLPF